LHTSGETLELARARPCNRDDVAPQDKTPDLARVGMAPASASARPRASAQQGRV